MCGIFGVLNSETSWTGITGVCKFMEEATEVGVLRGRDSTGMFQVSKSGDVRGFKVPMHGLYASTDERAKPIFRTADSSFATIGHHRAATSGSVSWANAHPFEHRDGTRHLVGVHNGSLHSWYVNDGGKAFDVDSDWLYHSIFTEGALKTLQELDGAAALVWYENDGRGIRMFRNEERPLFFSFIKDKNTMLLASEHPMLYWLADRNKLVLEKMYFIEPGKIYYFPQKDVRGYSEEPVPERPKKQVAASAATSHTSTIRGGTSDHKGWPDENWPHGGARENWDYQEAMEEARARRGRTEAEAAAARAVVRVANQSQRPLQLPAPSTKFEGQDIVQKDDVVRQRIRMGCGEHIEFFLHWERTLACNDANVLHGEVWMPDPTDNQPIPAIMVDVDENTRDNVLNASREQDMVKCRVGGVTRIKINGTFCEAAVVTKPVSIIKNLDDGSTAVAEITLSDDVATIPGPHGKPITKAEFGEYALIPCGICDAHVTVNEAIKQELEWAHTDIGDVPVHKACAIEQRAAISGE